MNATDKIIEKYNNGKVENFLTIFSGDIQLFYKFIDKKGKLTLKNQNMRDNLINQKLNKDIKEMQILFKMNK